MLELKKFKIKIIEILFYAFPLSFILGNFILSTNLLLFLVFSLFFIKSERLSFRFNNSYWILISFFLYFCLVTITQFTNQEVLSEAAQDLELKDNPILKSFLLIRFLILIFVVDTLFFNKVLELKNFFLSSLICSSFLSFDIIVQYVVGYDLFGIKSLGNRNSGPFGDEYIAGSYIQKFSLLSFFYFFEIFKNKKFHQPLLFFLIIIHGIAVLMSGNRMPMLLFIFGCVLVIIFIKNLRLIMTSALLIFLSLSFVIIKNDAWIKTSYTEFFEHINILRVIKTKQEVVTTKVEKNEKYKNREYQLLYGSGHNGIYRLAIMVWKEQPLFGFGLKSYRIKSSEVESKIKGFDKDAKGSNHPHHYYLEFLVESGIVGTILLLIFFVMLFKDSFYYLKKKDQITDPLINFFIPIIIILFIELWPLKSSGSFFSNWVATFFWLNVAMLLAILGKKVPTK